MFELVKFSKEHLRPMMNQKKNGFIARWLEHGHADIMEREAASFTGVIGDKVAVCGGITFFWPGRGYLWAIFSEDFRENFVPVFRGVKKALDALEYTRLEMAIALECDDYSIAVRRAKLLGFKLECHRAEKYLPSGQDCSIYARIK